MKKNKITNHKVLLAFIKRLNGIIEDYENQGAYFRFDETDANVLRKVSALLNADDTSFLKDYLNCIICNFNKQKRAFKLNETDISVIEQASEKLKRCCQ